MSTSKALRARPPHALRVTPKERIDVALLHWHIALRTYLAGLPVDWEHACRRMAEALGWDGGTGQDPFGEGA